MGTFTFDDFSASARGQGFDEVVERRWKPDTVLDTHTHAFAVKALVVRGHLLPGDAFQLDREVPHAERYGKDGATYWVARRN